MRLLLALALFLAACRQTAPDAPVGYRPADGSFTAAMPGDWKVDDGPGESRKAAFFGPPGGEAPFSQSIRVSLYADRTPEGYVASLGTLAPPLRKTTVGGRDAWEFERSEERRDPHAGLVRTTTRAVLVPDGGSVWALELVRPEGAEPHPAFAELLRTFKVLSK